MRVHRTRERSGSWFEPREPDQAVRLWGDALARSGRRNVLDVGCGGGRHVIHLLRLGLSVTAGDLWAPALAEAQRWLTREGLCAHLVQLDMTALPFRSEAFDAVLSVNVLHHAQPHEARLAVQEAWRVLCPGGLFLAVLAGPRDCRCLLERPAAPPEPAFAPECDAQDLRGLFSGFRVLETRRRRLRVAANEGGPSGWGVNWRVWAERPVV